MISQLYGKIISNQNGEITLMTSGGVGYRILVSPSAAKLAVVDSEIKLDTYLVVREDALDLFGFGSLAEKELFKQFLSVSGVGPKTAVHLLELGGVEEITLAIGRGDVEFLTKVSGIGKKTAERIVVDLKNKVKNQLAMSNEQLACSSDAQTDVIDALVTLGYSVLQAREAVQKLDAKGKTSEVLLREALRMMK